MTLQPDRLDRAEERLDQAEAAIQALRHVLETAEAVQGVARRAHKGLRVTALLLAVAGVVAIVLVVTRRPPIETSARSSP